MSAISVRVNINASPSQVWVHLSDISAHAHWMQDAVAIRFISKQKRGVGTRFECDTKIWKLPLKDKLTITYWEDDYYMGVEHTGLVGGSGTFVLEPNGRGGTEFIWEEDLIFPWYFGGPVGALIARPVMTKVWRANLAALKHIVELAHS